MDVKEIVKKYLRDNKFDGLFNEGECCCETCDLAPCDEIRDHCEPGYKVPCDPEDCSADGNCGWHIGRTKEPTP